MSHNRTPEAIARTIRPDLDPDADGAQARSFNCLVHLVTVVQECDALRKQGARNAAGVIAERHGVSASTVRGWLHRAKWRGIEPGPPPRVVTPAEAVTRALAVIDDYESMDYYVGSTADVASRILRDIRNALASWEQS